jgi:SAM-dependent methyltransferase
LSEGVSVRKLLESSAFIMVSRDRYEMQLNVPGRFNKNASSVQALGTQAETGTQLIEYMCERLAVPNLAALDVLDFGCGCRFAEAIVNNRLPVHSYVGIDLDSEMIAWLNENVRDPRLSFYHWNAHNPMYNPYGFHMTAGVGLPVRTQTYDLICMFSVMTHQLPEDTRAIFRLLRRYIRPHGKMFFSANIQQFTEEYREMDVTPTLDSAYSERALRKLLERSGWRVLSRAGKNPQDARGRAIPIQDSLLCAPTSLIRRILRSLRE